MRHSRSFARLVAGLIRLTGDRRAATAVEYGLIVALIVLAMIASFQGVANATIGLWSNTQTRIANATAY